MVSEYGRWIGWDSPINEAITIFFQVFSKSIFRNYVTVQRRKDNILIDFREMVSEYGRWIGWDSPIN